MVFLFFGSFAHHFQTKLSTFDSSLNFIFRSMSELEFFLTTRILTQNSNIMKRVKFLEKKSKTSHSNHSGHIEDDIMQNNEQEKKK
jgi:hypothetical protein